MTKKLKRIISSMVLVTLLVPNIYTKADLVSNVETEISVENNSNDVVSENETDLNETTDLEQETPELDGEAVNSETSNVDEDIADTEVQELETNPEVPEVEEDSETPGVDVSPEMPEEETNPEFTEEEKVEETPEVEDEVSDLEANESETEDETVDLETENVEEEVEENTESETDEVEEKQQILQIGTLYEVEEFIADAPVQHNGIMTEQEIYDSERVEFQLIEKEKETYTRIKTKTDSNYEIAMAHDNGSYTYLADTNDFEEAKNIIAEETSTLEAMPVVINEFGQIVYSNYSMARVWKHINGKPYSGNGRVTNLYSDSALRNNTGYINQSAVSDLPVMQFNGSTSAKIMVSGEAAWVNMNTRASEYDVLIYPVNQITNPTHYYVSNGMLYHFIAANPLTPGSGHALRIGKAPSYLSTGVKYFSYDGNYFYSGSSVADGLLKLVKDYNAGTRVNSVNYSNPYYNYYQNLPFRSKTIYTAAQINSFIASNTSSNSKLRNAGQALKDAEAKYGVNALLVLGIAAHESGWGMSSIAQSKNNIFGLNAVDSNPSLAANQFASVAACIEDFAKNWISRGYSDPADFRYYGGFLGNKHLGLNVKYASDPYWSEKVARYAFDADLSLSGNVNSLKDTDNYQLAILPALTSVVNSSNQFLYNGKSGAPVIIKDKNTVNISGKTMYKIYPERTTAVSNGKYHGSYDFNYNGYVNASGIRFVNTEQNVGASLTVLGGQDRFETAVKISQSHFSKADTVVLVQRYAIFDGISATPLATVANGPILYTNTSSLGSVTKAEIARLKPSKVIIVGGSGIITSNVVNELKAMGINTVDRLGGATRYDTSLEVAKYIDSRYYDVSNIFLVNGQADADAMSAGAVGGKNRMPILLTNVNSIPTNTYNWLKSENLSSAYVVGGTGVVSNGVLNVLNGITSSNISQNRVGGLDRQETNARIIQEFYGNDLKAVYAARSHVLFDALAVGPVAALNGAPVVLINAEVNAAQKSVLANKYTKNVIQTGLNFPAAGIQSLINALKKTP